MMMDSDSSYKPNGDYLVSSYSWHTPQDLQFANLSNTYPYDYGIVVKSEYDDCSVGGSSPSQENDSAEMKKGTQKIRSLFILNFWV